MFRILVHPEKFILHLEIVTKEQKCCSEMNHALMNTIMILPWKGILELFLTLINSILQAINRDIHYLLLLLQQEKKHNKPQLKYGCNDNERVKRSSG